MGGWVRRPAGLLPADQAAGLPVTAHVGLVAGSLSLAWVRPGERRAHYGLVVDSITSFRLVSGRACSDLAWCPMRAKNRTTDGSRGQLGLVAAGLPGAGPEHAFTTALVRLGAVLAQAAGAPGPVAGQP